MKSYCLGDNRTISLVKAKDGFQLIKLSDAIKNKTIQLPTQRWKVLIWCIDAIEQSLRQLFERKEVDFKHHIGGGWYITVKSGIYCIDIRRFFIPIGQREIKSTRDGFALRIREWRTFKSLVRQISADHPHLKQVVPCRDNIDHQNQEGAFQCRECYAFPDSDDEFDLTTV